MDCGGGWRVEGVAQDKSVMNVMLRFRPIAPKPASGRAGVGADSKSLVGFKGRTKRKYVRVRRNSGYRRSTKKEVSGEDQTVVTLQLLPGKVDQAEEEEDGTAVRTGLGLGVVQEDPPTWREADQTVVETVVTVECVTDSSTGVGCREMEMDTCPVMISDGLNRVVWVNGAYRRMVRQENEKQEVKVGLVVKEKVPSTESGGFSCRVRVQYKMKKKMDQWSQMVMPCDVWKINGGGFAWRLDIEAALSLGR